mmetsp:Transcript_56591/g.143222  ORF Transcript_56591/g.143222 Transcript_56591/m.143222 type:complete len:118 (-) Transcript_56591:576-929(-)
MSQTLCADDVYRSVTHYCEYITKHRSSNGGVARAAEHAVDGFAANQTLNIILLTGCLRVVDDRSAVDRSASCQKRCPLLPSIYCCKTSAKVFLWYVILRKYYLDLAHYASSERARTF